MLENRQGGAVEVEEDLCKSMQVRFRMSKEGIQGNQPKIYNNFPNFFNSSLEDDR